MRETGPPMTVRKGKVADLPAITEIYAHAVLQGTASFEIDPPGIEEMARRYEDAMQRGLPYLVCEQEGEVLGYAYASPYRSRQAYRHTIEDSIYIHPGHQGHGHGKILLAALIEASERSEWHQMVAVIGGSENLASIRLHERFGFRHVGTLQGVGFKFGRWLDTVLMQRALG